MTARKAIGTILTGAQAFRRSAGNLVLWGAFLGGLALVAAGAAAIFAPAGLIVLGLELAGVALLFVLGSE